MYLHIMCIQIKLQMHVLQLKHVPATDSQDFYHEAAQVCFTSTVHPKQKKNNAEKLILFEK